MNMIYKLGDVVGYAPIALEQASVAIEPERWFGLRIFANKEHKVMRVYEQRGISAYFPTIRNEQIIETRRFGHLCRCVKRTVIGPLFPGVIFIPDFQAKLGGVMVDGVEGYMRMDQCYPYLTPELMGYVRELAAVSNIPVARARRLLREGQRVYVTDGPFAMFSGKFDRLDSDGRLKVLVDLFGRMTPVTLDECQIEPA